MTPKPSVPPYFGFHDVHGFKDYLVEVQTGAPDDFMEVDWLPASEQLTLERAFEGLEYGYRLVAWEFQKPSLVSRLRQLTSEALAMYRNGDAHSGQNKLAEVGLLLSSLPTQ